MCKHCKISKLDNINLVAYKKRPLKFNQTRIGIEDISVSMGRKDDESEWFIKVDHGVTDRNLEEIDCYSLSMKINYCPFCGEKLADIIIEE